MSRKKARFRADAEAAQAENAKDLEPKEGEANGTALSVENPPPGASEQTDKERRLAELEKEVEENKKLIEKLQAKKNRPKKVKAPKDDMPEGARETAVGLFALGYEGYAVIKAVHGAYGRFAGPAFLAAAQKEANAGKKVEFTEERLAELKKFAGLE